MINIETLKNLLDRLGLHQKTDICLDGQLAIDTCKQIIDDALKRCDKAQIRPIDLCLLDQQMPKKDGMQVVQEIRDYIARKQTEYFEQTQIQEPEFVFLTAYKSRHFAGFLRQLNIKQCYEKPIQLEQLQYIVENLSAKDIQAIEQ